MSSSDTAPDDRIVYVVFHLLQCKQDCSARLVWRLRHSSSCVIIFYIVSISATPTSYFETLPTCN